jgi:hypothetical protein
VLLLAAVAHSFIGSKASGAKVKEILDNANVAVWVESDGAASQTAVARLVDLAEDGFKLALAETLALDGKKRQTLCLREQGVNFRLDGIFCSERQISKQVNNLECSFSPPIPKPFFALISQGSLSKSRCHSGIASDARTSVAWNLDEDFRGVGINDISVDGFCLWTDTPGKLGERLHLLVEDVDSPLMVVGQARWEFKTEIGFLLGCSFLNSRDCERLQVLLSLIVR